MGEWFYNLKIINPARLKIDFPCHQLHPAVDLLLRCIEKFQLFSGDHGVCPVQNWQNLPTDLKVTAAERINELSDYFRQEAAAINLRKRVGAFSRGSNKNYLSLKKYIRDLFNAYARLMVIRIDLGYRKDHCGNISFQSIKRHIEQFLKNRHDFEIFGYMVGYALRIEYGPLKGMHVHAMLFFDGSKVNNHEWYADEVGKYWVNNITQGLGVYYNCNRYPFKYRYCGIGMVDHHDAEKRKNVELAATYLTKIDHFLKLQVPKGVRTFQKGVAPRRKLSKDGKPMGRQRVKRVIQPRATATDVGLDKARLSPMPPETALFEVSPVPLAWKQDYGDL